MRSPLSLLLPDVDLLDSFDEYGFAHGSYFISIIWLESNENPNLPVIYLVAPLPTLPAGFPRLVFHLLEVLPVFTRAVLGPIRGPSEPDHLDSGDDFVGVDVG